MKRILLIGLVFAANPFSPMCHGEGYIVFNTYVGTVYQPISYAAPLPTGATNGQTVGAGFQAELDHGLGSGLPFSQLSAVPGSADSSGHRTTGIRDGRGSHNSGLHKRRSGDLRGGGVQRTDLDRYSKPLPLRSDTGVFRAVVGRTWTESAVSTDPGSPDYFTTNLPPIVVTTSLQDAPPPSPPRLSVLSANSQSITFQLKGTAHLRYVVQSSTNLVNWSSISTNILPTETVVFTNSVTGSSRRFWRALWVP